MVFANLSMATILLVLLTLSCNVDAQSRNGSNIDCTSSTTGGCQGYLLNCTDFNSCSVFCHGRSSCRDAVITCPIDGDCNIYCGNENDSGDECHDARVNAQQSQSLTIFCTDKSETCEEMHIYCPISGPSSPACSIFGANANNIQLEMQIYAVQGLEDVLITGTNPQNVAIHCGENFNNSCIISPSFDSCQIGSSNTMCGPYTNAPTTNTPTTNTPTTNAPTTSDPTTDRPTTSEPTTYTPTTMIPTRAPTHNPSFSPTGNPIMESSPGISNSKPFFLSVVISSQIMKAICFV